MKKSQLNTFMYRWCLEWYSEDTKGRVKLMRELRPILKYMPIYKGVAYRANDEVGLSWSKNRELVKPFLQKGNKIFSKRIRGVDLEAVTEHLLRIYPGDSDLLDIKEVKEVVKLD